MQNTEYFEVILSLSLQSSLLKVPNIEFNGPESDCKDQCMRGSRFHCEYYFRPKEPTSNSLD